MVIESKRISRISGLFLLFVVYQKPDPVLSVGGAVDDAMLPL